MKDKLETLIGWIIVVAIIYAAYFQPQQAHATKILNPVGEIQRPEQNWINEGFVKTPNISVNMFYGGCPDWIEIEGREDREGTWSCVPHAAPNDIYLYPHRDRWFRRWTVFHELFHVITSRGLYEGPLVQGSKEKTADAYANCALDYYYRSGYGAPRWTYPRTCDWFNRHIL